MWRGKPLADVSCELLRRDELPGLEELRLQALEWRADAGLGLGRHGELAAELRPLTAAHPLRERFYAQLMLAQYRCGRQAEALATYQCARQMLAEALGADPGTELRDIHQRILTADPSLDLPRHPESASPREDSAPVISDQSGPPRSLRSRAPRGALTALAAAALAAASAVLITDVVSGTVRDTSPAAAAGYWQCGPFMSATLRDGHAAGQSLQACIASDHGHLVLKGVLKGSVNAWKEQVILVLKHPGPTTYGKSMSPVCTTSTCVYQVAENPGHGSWLVVPQWRADGRYQSTGQPSPPVTY